MICTHNVHTHIRTCSPIQYIAIAILIIMSYEIKCVGDKWVQGCECNCHLYTYAKRSGEKFRVGIMPACIQC